MALVPSSVNDFYMSPNAIVFALNALGDKDTLSVSVYANAKLTAYRRDVIPYNPDNNYRLWTITAYNTHFDDDVPRYAHLAISRTGDYAFVVYPKTKLDIFGRSMTDNGQSFINDKGEVCNLDENGDYVDPNGSVVNLPSSDAEYWYMYLGKLSGSATGYRQWIDEPQSGNLDTDRYRNEENGGAWEKMFRLNTITNMIVQLLPLSELILGSAKKVISNIWRSTDDGTPPLPDQTVPTVAYVKKLSSEEFLSKKHDDTAHGKITFAKGADFGQFESGLTNGQGGNIDEHGNAELNSLGLRGAVTFKGANQGTTGAGIWEDEYGWHIQTDYLTVFNKAEFAEVEIQKVSHVGGQVLLTAASCTASRVEQVGKDYRVYFNAKDSDGNEIDNLWDVDDIAYCETFNLARQENGMLGNHYYKYVVKGKGISSDGNLHYILLDGSNKDAYSDAPLSGDSIVQLGNIDDSKGSRQSAILIQGAGSNSPCILEYSHINTFRLPAPETQIKPNNNIFTGQFIIKNDSKFEDGTNLKDTLDNLSVGENLLRNSGFRGNMSTIQMDGKVEGDTETYSPSLEYWVSESAVVVEQSDSLSGYAVYINGGSIVQTLEESVESDKDYIISFRAIGVGITIECGGFEVEQELSGSTGERYIFKFKAAEEGRIFKVSSESSCQVYELMLEQGTIPSTSWKEHRLDIPESMIDYESLQNQHINAALQGSTSINGGLILTNLLMLGKEKNESGEKTVTAGINGLRWDDNSVAHWGGGTLEQAIYTVAQYLNNPSYKPTEEEVSKMAMFVVTHGGRAILNDIIARGTIYAKDGEFNGEIRALDKTGTLVSSYNANGDGTIVYYYPNGNVMKQERFVMNGDTVVGLRTEYYRPDGEIAWVMDETGYHNTLNDYWSHMTLRHLLVDELSDDAVVHGVEAPFQYSKFTTYSSGLAPYDGLVVEGEMVAQKPADVVEDKIADGWYHRTGNAKPSVSGGMILYGCEYYSGGKLQRTANLIYNAN